MLTTGSAGTIGCGDFLKELFPTSKVAASEALQCPTLILNGFAGFYEEMARLYFERAAARALSREYYAALQTAVRRQDPDDAERITRAVMARSIALWHG